MTTTATPSRCKRHMLFDLEDAAAHSKDPTDKAWTDLGLGVLNERERAKTVNAAFVSAFGHAHCVCATCNANGAATLKQLEDHMERLERFKTRLDALHAMTMGTKREDAWLATPLADMRRQCVAHVNQLKARRAGTIAATEGAGVQHGEVGEEEERRV